MNSPDSYIEFIESTPPVAPIKFESELQQTDPRPRRLIPLFAVISLFGLVGIVGSFVYLGQAQKLYESHATICVEISNDAPLSDREFEEFKNAEHELLIKQYNVIYRAINRATVPSLKFLRELSQREEDEKDREFDAVDAITDALTTTVDPAESSIVDLSFRCPVQMDTQTILRHVILAYREIVIEQYQAAVINRMNRLFQSRRQIEEELQLANEAEEDNAEYVAVLQDKLARVKAELFDVKIAGSPTGQYNHVRFETLSPPAEGELVWPDPMKVIPCGLGIGLIVGLVIGLFGIFATTTNRRSAD